MWSWLALVGCTEITPNEPAVPLVAVAASTLPIGHVITPGDLSLGIGPPVDAPDGPIGPEVLVGMTVCSPILAGETFQRTGLSERDGVGIEACVPEGSRLFTVAVPTVAGITVGSTVDLVDLTGVPEVVEPAVPVLRIDGDTLQVLVRAGPGHDRLGVATRVAALLRSPLDGIAPREDVDQRFRVLRPGDRAVAARRLEPGRPITGDDLVGVEGEGGVTVDAAIDAVPKEPILPGEWVRSERLANFALDPTGKPVDTFVPRGMRTATVLLEPMAHTVRAGSTLDLFVPGSAFRLQAVPVFATGRDHAVLVVEAHDALALLALGATPLRWSLRNPLDVTIVAGTEDALTQ